MVAQLDKIAHSAFAMPKLPPPPPPGAGPLPPQIAALLAGITAHLDAFPAHAPHTVQRLAELVLAPRAHYSALASYLHAVDRVVQVTSGTDAYPLPPAVPDLSAVGGSDADDARNPVAAALGSDEALGGALLTPIPWLTRRSPESNGDAPAAHIRSEGTETIEDPNGVGSVETVSVSINGVPSTGHARGITQGELLRQEQRAGVVPVSQLSRAHEAPPSDEDRAMDDAAADETPHARGPDEIGIGDTGPQSAAATTSYDGVATQAIDVEAAVGRRRQADADLELDAAAPKKAKEGGDDAAQPAPAQPPAETDTSEADASEPGNSIDET